MPSPIIFTIGPFTLRWYGVFIVLAALAGSLIAAAEARRRGENPDHVWQALPLMLIFGIIGARLGFVLVNLSNFQSDPIRMLYVWEGGLSIQGGFVAGIVALIIYVRRNHLSFFRWADIGIVGVPLGQAIGRWGNFFNQEAYGEPCSQPWCIPIAPDRRPAAIGLKAPDGTPFPADYGADTNFHFAPTFAYEMLWDLGTFGLLWWLSRTRRFGLREGDLLWVYGVVYSLGRFVVEAVRLDSASAGGFRAPQLFAVATILVCWAMFIYRHRPGTSAPLATSAAPALAEDTAEDEATVTNADAAWEDDTEDNAEADTAWEDEEDLTPALEADDEEAADRAPAEEEPVGITDAQLVGEDLDEYADGAEGLDETAADLDDVAADEETTEAESAPRATPTPRPGTSPTS
jgi:phosphatidylglycerol:prolipoprotein diacylglycerol transferase